MTIEALGLPLYFNIVEKTGSYSTCSSEPRLFLQNGSVGYLMKFFCLVHSNYCVNRKLRKLLDESPVSYWIYLGKDRMAKTAWQNELRSIDNLSIQSRLNKKARDLRLPFVNWVDAIGEQFGNSMEWWTSSLAEKNVLSSDLFLNFCYLVLGRKIQFYQ